MKEHNTIELIRASKPFHLDKGVYGRFIRGTDGRVELAIIVRDWIGSDDWQNLRNPVENLRARLRKIQGDKLDDPITLIKLSKAVMHSVEGFSYAEIAMDVNYSALVHLYQAVSAYEAGLETDAISSIRTVIALLRAMQMKDKDIREWLKAGITEITEGRAPWTLTRGPVNKPRVVDAIRYFKQKVKSGSLMNKTKPEADLAPLSQMDRSPNQRAEALLRLKSDSSGLDKLEKAYRAFVVRLAEE